MKRKVLACVLAAVMSFSLLTACGGSTNNSSGAGQSAQGGGDTSGGAPTDVSLKVWAPANQIDSGLMADQQKAFEAAHPEWKITWETAIQGEDVAATEVLKDVEAAGDIFMFASDQLPNLVDAGAIAKLGGEAKKMVEETNSESMRTTVTYNGDIYAVPFTPNTFFMFYDKTLLDAADLTSMEKIMAKDLGDGVYNFFFDSAGGWKAGCFWYGAGLSIFGPAGNDVAAGIDWNNATGVAVTNYIIDLSKNPKCAFANGIPVAEYAKDHKLGAWFDGAWNYETYKNALGDDLGMAILPTFNPDGKDYQLRSFSSSKAIGVNAKSKSMAAAVAFAAFLGNEENQILRFEKSNQPPTNLNAGQAEAVLADPVAAVLAEEVSKASVFQPVSAEFSKGYWNYADAIITDIKSGATTKDNAQAKMDEFVKNMTP